MADHLIRLDEKRHAGFLAEGRQDPVTKQFLKPGMEIVICANDKIAFIHKYWTGRCPLCGGTKTLPGMPGEIVPPTKSSFPLVRTIGIASALLVVGVVVVAALIGQSGQWQTPEGGRSTSSSQTEGKPDASSGKVGGTVPPQVTDRPPVSEVQRPQEPSPFATHSSPWVFPDSDRRFLGDADLRGLSSEQLWRARNEIFARRGYRFQTSKGQVYARELGNYYIGREPDQKRLYSLFNKFERHNVELIKQYEGIR
ncbi:MAG: YARHG domain-containing protein [Pseudomonadota bacterium]